MKLISYNVRYSYNGDQLFNELKRFIAKFNPDYFCLQEYAYKKNIEKLFEENEYTIVTFAYDKHKIGEQNLFIAYKKHIKEKRFWTFLLPASAGSKDQIEYRGIMITYFETGDTDQIIVNLHLPVREKYKEKIDFLAKTLRTYTINENAEVYVCGDFNITQRAYNYLESTMQALGFQTLSPKETTSVLLKPEPFESFYPLRKYLQKSKKIREFGFRLDWIFANLEDLDKYKLTSKVLKDATASNHFPVYVEVDRE